jgi:hypothetical protein
MSSSQQAKRIVTQGKKIMTNNRTRPVMEKDPKTVDTDDSQEETNVQPMNAAAG